MKYVNHIAAHFGCEPLFVAAMPPKGLYQVVSPNSLAATRKDKAKGQIVLKRAAAAKSSVHMAYLC